MSEIMIKNGDCTAVINNHGAELKSFKKGDREYMWCADPKFWARTSPVLFPFVGAVRDKKFTYEGVEYPMGQHGFARDMDFELVSKDETSCKYVLKSNDETRKLYPLDFELYIGYAISDGALKVEWEVVNPSEKTLEFSIGAHPAFNCILSDCGFVLRKNGEVVKKFTNSVFGTGLLTNKKAEVELPEGFMKMDEHTFDGDAYVIENDQVDCVELLDKEGKVFLAVDFTSPLVGIWSPPTKNAPFICIEPWYGRADKEDFVGELSDREWNNSLKKDEKFAVSYTIRV